MTFTQMKIKNSLRMLKQFFTTVEQDARYAPAYFPPSIESGNRKIKSSLVIRNLLLR